MFLLIDNYDSFTYNLWHYLGELGAEVIVKRNDALTVADVLAMKPGGHRHLARPEHPENAGILHRTGAAGGTAFRSSASASAIRRSARRSAARSSARPSRCTARSADRP